MKNKFNIKSLKMYVLGGLCGILAVFSIFMTIETATSGAEIASFQKKEALLMGQQQDLQENLVENLSVSSLREKSVEMGFTKVSSLVYVANAEDVSGGVPVARLP